MSISVIWKLCIYFTVNLLITVCQNALTLVLASPPPPPPSPSTPDLLGVIQNLKIPGFKICLWFWKYTGFSYAWICLNNSWICMIILEYTWTCLNMPEYAKHGPKQGKTYLVITGLKTTRHQVHAHNRRP